MAEAKDSGARPRLRLYSALLSLAVLPPLTAVAQSTWTGAGGSDFSDGANWDTAPAAPGAGDAAVIPSGTPIAGSSAEVRTLDVSGGTLKVDADLTVSDGTQISGTGRVEVSTGGELNSNVGLTGGYLGVSGTLAGDVDASGGTFINDGTVDGQAGINGGTLTNNGTLRDLGITSGGIVTNNATATVTGATGVENGSLTNNGALNAVDVGSAGIFTNNSGATAGAVTNAGTASNAGNVSSLNNTNGSFTNGSGGTITGNTTVAGGTVTNNFVVTDVDVAEAAAFINNAGATAGAVTNAGTSSNGGTIASLDNTGGSFTNNNGGTITGMTTVTGGTVTNNFVVTDVDVAEAAEFVNNLGATASVVTNAGTASNAGTVAALTNTGGTFSNNAGGTITGTTTVTGGTVTNNSAMADVDVAAGGTFVNNSAGSAGAVSNAGTGSNDGTMTSLTNAGGSFANTGTIAGAATVTGGTVVNDGTVSGTVAIYTGGILAGTGSIGGLTVGAGGVVSPGPGFATISVTGDVTFEADSTYRADIDPTGLSDRIDATGAVTINGGTLQIFAASGSYAPTTIYTLLTGSSVSGEFDTVTTDLAFLSPTVTYGAGDVSLEIERNTVAFADVADTANGRATAAAVEALDPTDPLFSSILPLDAGTARSAFSQLSGETHASLKSALFQDSRFLRDTIIDRATGAAPTVELGGGSLWLATFGASSRFGSDGNASGFTGRTGGLVAGADGEVVDSLRLGGLLGYSQTWAGREADVESYHAGLYAVADWQPLTFTGGALYAWNQVSTDRSIDFGNFSDRLKANYDSRTAQVFGDLAWTVPAGDVVLQPFANLAYIHLDTDRFTESGGAAALTGRGGSEGIGLATLGLRWSADIPGELPATFSGMFGWRRGVGDLAPSTALAFAGASPFMIEGVTLARDSAVVEAGVTAQLSRTARLKFTYSGEFAGDLAAHALKANLSVDF
ncbi:autotransporter outer membrane beta-barrel domain-containing protein [Neorhizobium sp. SOG26]|uniref:autotransporter outer membrane beta-barrel domain-containing protein n=1 Tax=Neorhizobium sp. SOG26 TaxID=2060726 RepID=UPI000E585771|nr:autotransporter domain-containing protein [Neorhizobium sp. SOG26]AXV14635.1 autotransporter outer membrane beta-barrel domain-containing protein [Neorhizobium sp. SOG26]